MEVGGWGLGVGAGGTHLLLGGVIVGALQLEQQLLPRTGLGLGLGSGLGLGLGPGLGLGLGLWLGLGLGATAPAARDARSRCP